MFFYFLCVTVSGCFLMVVLPGLAIGCADCRCSRVGLWDWTGIGLMI